MLRKPLLLALALAGCSKGPEADLPAIGEARSLTAEWAMVNELAARGRINGTYVKTMRKELREQLQSSESSLKQPHSDYGKEIEAALAEMDDAPPAALRGHSDRLKAIESSLESA